MKKDTQVVQVKGKKELLEALNKYLLTYGTTYINLHRSTGVTRFKFRTARVDTKAVKKLINKVKDCTPGAFK